MVLAETISIDAGALLLGLVVIVAGLALVVAGFFCAPRAARGSRLALGVWVAALVLEVAVLVSTIPAVLGGAFDLLLVPIAVITGQAVLYLRARAEGRG